MFKLVFVDVFRRQNQIVSSCVKTLFVLLLTLQEYPELRRVSGKCRATRKRVGYMEAVLPHFFVYSLFEAVCSGRYLPGICLDGLRKITKHLSQDNRCLGRDLSPGSPAYEAGMLKKHSTATFGVLLRSS
jgi:hypothetical protein